MIKATADAANEQAGVQRALAVVSLAYAPALLSMMTVGIIVPFIGALVRAFSATPAELGLSIALFSMPTAIFALAGGSIIDRFGVRRSLLVSLVIAAIASLLASFVASIQAFDAAILLAGLGYGGICIASPCLVMQLLTGEKRTRAMAFLSTYPPTGYAAGLLLGAGFVASDNWQLALRLHATLLALAFVILLRALPQGAGTSVRGSPVTPQPLRRIFAALREPRVIGLGIAVALPNAVSYGTSLAAPAHLARLHHVSLAMSSTAVAGAKIVALVIGSVAMGYLLSRSRRTTALFACMVVVGLVAQALIFLPIAGIMTATAALILWIFAFGGMAGGAMALLPLVVKDPSRSGAASGLVNQFISVASFAAPSTWLALHDGAQFIGLAAICLVVSFVALPKGQTQAGTR